MFGAALFAAASAGAGLLGLWILTGWGKDHRAHEIRVFVAYFGFVEFILGAFRDDISVSQFVVSDFVAIRQSAVLISSSSSRSR